MTHRTCARAVSYMLALAATALLCGCPPRVEKLEVCPGRSSPAEAIAALRARAEKTRPFRANGQCRIELHTEDKTRKENFPAKLWVNPPDRMYLQGDVAFDATGIVVAANAEEFWLWIRPKEVSTFWYGRWADAGRLERMALNPRMLLEGLGIAAMDDAEEPSEWSLSNKGPFDILTRKDEDGRLRRKLYVASCDYLVRKIEYFDPLGRVKALVELERYEPVDPNFSIPTIIRITNRREGPDDTVRLTFNPGSVKKVRLSQKQLDFLFQRPEPNGFANVWMYIDGQLIRQMR